MKVKIPIAITLVVLFLAANVGILYVFSGRFSGNSPNARNSTFADEAALARRGLDAFRRADNDQAIVAFDDLIRLQPNHSEAHRWRGDASLNKHELVKALSEYDEAIRLDPKNGLADSGRGAALTEKGEFDKAIACFDEATRLDPRIANLPFYKHYRAAAERSRAAAEVPWSVGLLVVVPLLAFSFFFALAAWPIVRHGKPKPDEDL